MNPRAAIDTRIHISWIFVTLLLVSCSDNPLDTLSADAVILAYGDSLTQGKGTSSDNSYPAVLARLSQRRVINRGISGETSAEGLARLPVVLDETQPDLMILMHGGNDILRNLDAGQAKSNLQQMIDLAKGRDVPVILVGVPEKKLFSSTAPFYRELAKSNELVFEDGIIASLLKKPTMKSDSVHFNSAGYAAIGETLFELIKDKGGF